MTGHIAFPEPADWRQSCEEAVTLAMQQALKALQLWL
jgi:hypothetical protein